MIKRIVHKNAELSRVLLYPLLHRLKGLDL
jgi:hypothetical protein